MSKPDKRQSSPPAQREHRRAQFGDSLPSPKEVTVSVWFQDEQQQFYSVTTTGITPSKLQPRHQLAPHAIPRKDDYLEDASNNLFLVLAVIWRLDGEAKARVLLQPLTVVPTA